ncbi:MAG: hypothetical protein AAF555_07360 [Verrucomicrobiota bacterium]
MPPHRALSLSLGSLFLLCQCDPLDHQARTVLEVPEPPAPALLERQGVPATEEELLTALQTDSRLLQAAQAVQLSQAWGVSEPAALLEKIRQRLEIRLLPSPPRHFEILFRHPDPQLAFRMSLAIGQAFGAWWTQELERVLAEQKERLESDLLEQQIEVEEARTHLLQALQREGHFRLTYPPETPGQPPE